MKAYIYWSDSPRQATRQSLAALSLNTKVDGFRPHRPTPCESWKKDVFPSSLKETLKSPRETKQASTDCGINKPRKTEVKVTSELGATLDHCNALYLPCLLGISGTPPVIVFHLEYCSTANWVVFIPSISSKGRALKKA